MNSRINLGQLFWPFFGGSANSFTVHVYLKVWRLFTM